MTTDLSEHIKRDAEWKADFAARVEHLEKLKRSAEKRAEQKPADITEHRDITKWILTFYRTIKRPVLDTSRPRGKKHLMVLLQQYPAAHLMRSVENYAIASKDTEECYRLNVGNFFGRFQYWLEYKAEDWEAPSLLTPQEQADREAYDRIGKDK